MTAVVKNITIDQGTTFTEIFDVEVLTDPTLPYNATTNPYIPLDLTGYTARLQVRKEFDSATTVLSLTDGSGITLGGATGRVTINITPAQTTAILFTGELVEYVYDLELVDGSNVKRPVQGSFTINREVTR